MQTTRNFVAVFIEFTTGTNFSHDDLQCGDAFLLMHIYRNTATVVFNANPVGLRNRDVNGVAMSS